MAEDVRECSRKKVVAPLLDELARPPGPALKACHDLGEEAMVTGVVSNERLDWRRSHCKYCSWPVWP